MYAVFTYRGKMPDSFRVTYKKICTEFFPQSNYDYGHGVELEIYQCLHMSVPHRAIFY